MGSADTTHSIMRAAGRFFSGTAISRVTGLVRDIALAAVYGTSPLMAAFWMAFRFANLLRRLLGEGAMQAAFIPHFEGLRHRDVARGFRFFRDLSVAITFVIILIIGMVEGGMWGWLSWVEVTAENQEILVLTAIQFPAILFICLYALNASFLQCEHRYFTASIAPSAFNIVVVIGALIIGHQEGYQDMVALSYVVVIAFILEWCMTLPHTVGILKRGLATSIRQGMRLFSPDVLGMIQPLFLGSLGVAAVQINSAVDVVFARYADLSGPAYLGYAIRLQQVPLAFIGIALSGAALPALSRAAKEGDFIRFREFLDAVTRRCFSLMVPATVLLLVSGGGMINLLFARGEFDALSVEQTSRCLWGYALGTLPSSMVFFLAGAFYARGNYRVPTIASMVSVGVNITLNAYFIFVLDMGATSVAIATSISAFINVAQLMFALKKEMGPIFPKASWTSWGKVCLATVAAGVATIPFAPEILTLFSGAAIAMPMGLWHQALYLAQQMVVFLPVLVMAAWVFRASDLLALFKLSSK